MDWFADVLKSTDALLVAAALSLIVGCASSKVVRESNASLDEAIGHFIDGDYERAEAMLVALTGSLEADEDLRRAYLYLGRTYMAQGDYERAAEALTRGRMLGGDIQFEQLLHEVQQHLANAPHTIRAQDVVTRAQLANLLAQQLGPATGSGDDAAGAAGNDMENHWAESYVGAVVRAGWMEVLPDGGFHPDDPVTHAALYFVVARTARTLGLGDDWLQAVMPDGVRGAVERDESGVVSGEDAMRAVERIADAPRP